MSESPSVDEPTDTSDTHNQNQKQIPTDELLADVLRVAANLVHPPKTSEYKEHGNYSYQTVVTRFGDWASALEAAGLNAAHVPTRQLSDDELVADIQTVATKVGQTPTSTEYKTHGSYSYSTINNRFGSWKEAVKAAGLETTTSRQPQTQIGTGELFTDLQRVAETIDGSLTIHAYDTHGTYSPHTILTRFDDWQTALKHADIPYYRIPISEAHSDTESTAVSDQQPETMTENRPDAAELVTDLCNVADAVAGWPTPADIREKGTYSVEDYLEHYGTWFAGLTHILGESAPTNEQIPTLLLEDLLTAYEHLDPDHPRRLTVDEINSHAVYPVADYRAQFDTLTDGIDAVLYEPLETILTMHKKPTHVTERVLDDYAPCDPQLYTARFGGVDAAIHAMVYAPSYETTVDIADELEFREAFFDAAQYHYGLSTDTMSQAHTLIDQLHNMDYIFDDMAREYAAALLLVARVESDPLRAKDLAALVDASANLITQQLKRFSNRLNIPVPVQTAEQLLDRYIDELGVGDERARIARELVTWAHESTELSGRSPTALVAAALYLAGLRTGTGVTQDELSEALDVSNVTIRNVYQIMDDHYDEVVTASETGSNSMSASRLH